MNVIVGSDASTHLPKAVLDDLLQRGHQVNRVGSVAGTQASLPQVARPVAEAVAYGQADEGVLFYWTGIGGCLAANKGPSVRATLRADAETSPDCGTGLTSCACRSAACPRLRLARSSRLGWPPRTT